MAPHLKKPPDRELPIEVWVDLLTHPEKNVSHYVNFEDASDAKYGFRPHAATFSRTNAWWLAEAALLSYWHDDAEAIDIYAHRTGLTCIPLAEGGTQCHLVVAPEFAIIAFRGTQPDEWQDIFDDTRFKMERWTNGYVHRGFREAFQRVAPKVLDAVTQHASNRPLWLTGHSLGAALATLAADALPNTTGVYTFGSPLVGDQVFSGHFNQRLTDRSFRYIDDQDIVTHVPPEPFGLPVGLYTHVNTSRAINQDGHIGAAPPTLLHFVRSVFGRPIVLFHLVQQLIAGRFPSMPDALADHAPVLYVTHVWNDVFTHGDSSEIG
jgi:triacylglycerol lipase